MITRNIQLDVALPGSQLALYARKGDKRVYGLLVSLCDRTAPVTVPEEWSATLRARKPDGTILLSGAAVEEGRIRAYFGVQAMTVAGVTRCEIAVYGEHGEALYSPRFDLYVEEPAVDDGEIESSDDFSALGDALARVNGAVEAANSAAEFISNVTADAHGLPYGHGPTADVERGANGLLIRFGITAGEPGKGLLIKAVYPTFAVLLALHPVGEPGDAYAVGDPEISPVLIYLWDTEKRRWMSAGTLGGDVFPINGVYPDAGGYRIEAADIPEEGGPSVQEALNLLKSDVAGMENHRSETVSEPAGVHGIRFHDRTLQILENGRWISLYTKAIGLRWLYIDGLERSWSDWGNLNLTWKMFENLMETEET